MAEPIPITPETKIDKLLESYPDLEDVLIAQAPIFKKLKNPVLRRTVAKAATLAKVAEMGNINIDKIIAELKGAAGQDVEAAGAISEETTSDDTPSSDKPAWVSEAQVSETLDADTYLARGIHPLEQVNHAVKSLVPGDVFLLTSSFRPAPLVEKMEQAGFRVFCLQRGPEQFETYIGPGDTG